MEIFFPKLSNLPSRLWGKKNIYNSYFKNKFSLNRKPVSVCVLSIDVNASLQLLGYNSGLKQLLVRCVPRQ